MSRGSLWMGGDILPLLGSGFSGLPRSWHKGEWGGCMEGGEEEGSPLFSCPCYAHARPAALLCAEHNTTRGRGFWPRHKASCARSCRPRTGISRGARCPRSNDHPPSSRAVQKCPHLRPGSLPGCWCLQLAPPALLLFPSQPRPNQRALLLPPHKMQFEGLPPSSFPSFLRRLLLC